MLLVSSGVTRNYSPDKIIEKWGQIGSLDKAAFAQLYNNLSNEDKTLYDECISLFEREIVDNLPVIPSKGGVKFKGSVIKSQVRSALSADSGGGDKPHEERCDARKKSPGPREGSEVIQPVNQLVER